MFSSIDKTLNSKENKCMFESRMSSEQQVSILDFTGFQSDNFPAFLNSKQSNHSSATRDLTRLLAFVIWKTTCSHFLLTVFSQYINFKS